MIKHNKRIMKLHNLTEQQKDKILKHIRVKELSIKNAALELGITAALISKIFTERFGKRDQKIKAMKTLNLNNKKELHDIKK